MNPLLEKLRGKAARLPLVPGVYIMKDAEGSVIYVGKSRKLKNRVTSYFIGAHNAKTEKMVSHVADFDYILCDGEMEALTLENTLIKKYSPHYNIRLKDAKTYPYIKVTEEEYPRVIVTRERKSDGGRYFGPYMSAQDARQAADTVNRIFSLVTCKRRFPRDIGKERPCLYAGMRRCLAPCTGKVQREVYLDAVRCAEKVLAGNIRDTVEDLTREMTQAAEAEEYERAAHYRDAMLALERLQEKQKVVGDAHENRDVFAIYEDDLTGVLAVLSIRDGKLQAKREFLFSGSALSSPDDTVSLILSYYEETSTVPKEILLSFPLDDESLVPLAEYLSRMSGKKVEIRTPQRGKLRALADMARKNAEERAARYAAETAKEDTTLITLARLLALEVVPERIESYDISEIGKEHITASMVVTDKTSFLRSDYRTFRMKTLDGVNDLAAMREALTRRVSHFGDGSPSLGKVPDLILLDGGAGQVRTVKEVFREAGVTVPVFGMVKDEYHKTRALTDGEGEISIANERGVYVFIYRLQEEVHRVAYRATMGAKSRTLRHSVLEKIPGIGEKKARAVLSKMSLSRLKTASEDEMRAAGITPSDAHRIYEYYRKEESKS